MSPDPLKPGLSGLTLGPILILVPHYAIKRPRTQAENPGPRPFDYFAEETVTVASGFAAASLSCTFSY